MKLGGDEEEKRRMQRKRGKEEKKWDEGEKRAKGVGSEKTGVGRSRE
jgi:hypothetical protein